MSESVLIAVVFSLVGGISVVVGLFLLQRRRSFLRTATPTQGTVVGITEGSGSEGGVVYSRVVRFKTQDGRDITFEEKSGSSSVKQKIGDPIPVRYQPDRPEKAIISTWYGKWFWPLFPVVFGLIFLVAGVLTGVLGSDDDPDDGASPATFSPGEIPTGEIPATTLPPLPGSLVTVNTPSGSSSETASCESGGGSSDSREFPLSLSDGTTVILTMSPFTGQGVYQGDTLRVTGTFFAQSSDPLSGVVIVDETETGGSINLSKGAYGISGTWDCSG